MTNTVEIRVLELLCSRLCHDLISPVSAINNGMELLADDPEGMGDDIRDLLASSGIEASRRLQFFRSAYGLGGDPNAPIEIDFAANLTGEFAAGGKVNLKWADAASFPPLSRDSVKSLINLVVLGIESMPRGGDLTVAPDASAAGTVLVTGTGRGARIADDAAEVLSGATAVDALTPRSVHAYFTKTLVERAGGTLDGSAEGETVTFRASNLS